MKENRSKCATRSLLRRRIIHRIIYSLIDSVTLSLSTCRLCVVACLCVCVCVLTLRDPPNRISWASFELCWQREKERKEKKEKGKGKTNLNPRHIQTTEVETKTNKKQPNKIGWIIEAIVSDKQIYTEKFIGSVARIRF